LTMCKTRCEARLVADQRGRDLDHPVDDPKAPTGKLNLRWVYLHVLEEYSQHTGHADLIRERIDGSTG